MAFQCASSLANPFIPCSGFSREGIVSVNDVSVERILMSFFFLGKIEKFVANLRDLSDSQSSTIILSTTPTASRNPYYFYSCVWLGATHHISFERRYGHCRTSVACAYSKAGSSLLIEEAQKIECTTMAKPFVKISFSGSFIFHEVARPPMVYSALISIFLLNSIEHAYVHETCV